MKKHIVIVNAVFLFLFVQTLWPQEKKIIPSSAPGMTTIIIVRHAEKDTMSIDPPLTRQGRERSALLAQILRSSGITTIYTTDYLRTQQTIQPIAESLHLSPRILIMDPDRIEEHAETLVRKILQEQTGKVILISSHSNVIPFLLRETGVKEKTTIADREYDSLFIVTVANDGKAHLLRLRYGEATE